MFKSMEDRFLKLCKLALDNDLQDDQIDPNYRGVIESKVNEFNEIFKLGGTSELKSDDNGTLLTPVPFAAPPVKNKDGKYKFVLVGLNPKLDEGMAADEKITAGNSWQSQAKFYNSWDVFNYVLNKDSMYYINRIKFFHALVTGNTIRKVDILTTYNCDTFFEAFQQVMAKAPTIFAEFLPLYSKTFRTLNTRTLENKISKIKGYKEYLEELKALIKEMLPEDGIIFFDGKNPSDIFREILKDEIECFRKQTFIYKKKEKFAYEICRWENRLVVFTGGTIYGAFTAINGERVGLLINDLKELTSVH